MNHPRSTRWPLLLLLILAAALVACVRPVERDDEAIPTVPVVVPTTAPVVEPTPLPPADATPADTGAPAAEGGESSGQPTAEAPGTSGETAAPAEATPVPETTTPPAGDVVHTVQSGDTLYRISQQYGVAIQDIVQANNLVDPNALEVGQQLLIPGSTSTGEGTAAGGATVDPATGERVHVVLAGENLFRIGLQYGFTAEELASYNGITDPTRIDVGQVIRIPPGE